MASSVGRKKKSIGDVGFPERLVAARLLRGYGLVELAEMAKVDKGRLSRMEHSFRAATEAETLFRLSDALKVRPEWLWRGVEPMEPDGASKRLRALRRHLESRDVPDPNLTEAIEKAAGRHHLAVIAVAKAIAMNGESHTVEGWLARFSEIESRVKPILPR